MSVRILVALLLSVVLVSPTPAQVPSGEFASWVFIAELELRTPGMNVSAGNVGVNDGSLLTSGPLRAPTSQIVAEHVRLDVRSTCAELFSNDEKRPVPGCGPATPLVGPLFDLAAECEASQPFPQCDDAADVLVEKAETDTLAPGMYGDVTVRNGAELTLEGGEYVFCRLRVGRDARFLFADGARVSVRDDAVFSNSAFVGPAPGTDVNACDVRLLVNDEVRIQRRSEVHARVCALNGSIHVNDGANVEGNFIARTIRAGAITAQACPAVPGTTTTSTTGTTSTSTGTTTTQPSTTTSTSTTTQPTTTSSTSSTTTSTTATTSSTTSSTASTSSTTSTTTTTSAPSTTTTTQATTTTTSTVTSTTTTEVSTTSLSSTTSSSTTSSSPPSTGTTVTTTTVSTTTTTSCPLLLGPFEGTFSGGHMGSFTTDLAAVGNMLVGTAVITVDDLGGAMFSTQVSAPIACDGNVELGFGSFFTFTGMFDGECASGTWSAVDTTSGTWNACPVSP